MSWGQFIKDKWIFCVTQIVVILFIGTLLSVYRLNTYGIVFVCMMITIIDTALLLGEYIQKRMYYQKFLKMFDQLDKKRLISELGEEPNFQEGKIWWEVLTLATKSMNDEVSKYRVLQEEYKDYIEAWIHEIKTPIASIGLLCENHKDERSKWIAQEMNRIDSFVEQALFYARSTSIEKDYMIREVSLEELVRTAIKKQAKQIIACKVNLQLGKLEDKVFVDPKWVDFMLGQVITNSLKYKKEDLTLQFEGEVTDTGVILKIIDNGIGIPAKDIARVFDKGFTGENGRKYAKSTGIGLYLCQKLCKKMHLAIRLVAQEGEGTQVSFIFPKDKKVFFEG